MLKAQTKIPMVSKAGFNSLQKYAFASYEHYENAMAPALAECDLIVTSSVTDIKIMDRISNKEAKYISVYVKLAVRATHGQSGEWIEVDAWGEGADHGDKATYKAITGARKYGAALLFKMVTTDDPEGDEGTDRNLNGNGSSRPAANTGSKQLEDMI